MPTLVTMIGSLTIMTSIVGVCVIFIMFIKHKERHAKDIDGLYSFVNTYNNSSKESVKEEVNTILEAIDSRVKVLETQSACFYSKEYEQQKNSEKEFNGVWEELLSLRKEMNALIAKVDGISCLIDVKERTTDKERSEQEEMSKSVRGLITEVERYGIELVDLRQRIEDMDSEFGDMHELLISCMVDDLFEGVDAILNSDDSDDDCDCDGCEVCEDCEIKSCHKCKENVTTEKEKDADDSDVSPVNGLHCDDQLNCAECGKGGTSKKSSKVGDKSEDKSEDKADENKE